eukprot:scaffold210658_cov31-Tisochrysis_lutea.AAC.3
MEVEHITGRYAKRSKKRDSFLAVKGSAAGCFLLALCAALGGRRWPDCASTACSAAMDKVGRARARAADRSANCARYALIPTRASRRAGYIVAEQQGRGECSQPPDGTHPHSADREGCKRAGQS